MCLRPLHESSAGQNIPLETNSAAAQTNSGYEFDFIWFCNKKRRERRKAFDLVLFEKSEEKKHKKLYRFDPDNPKVACVNSSTFSLLSSDIHNAVAFWKLKAAALQVLIAPEMTNLAFSFGMKQALHFTSSFFFFFLLLCCTILYFLCSSLKLHSINRNNEATFGRLIWWRLIATENDVEGLLWRKELVHLQHVKLSLRLSRFRFYFYCCKVASTNKHQLFAHINAFLIAFFLLFLHYIYSACNRNFVKSVKSKLPDIPPFRGHVANNMYNKIVDTIKKSSTG